MNPQTFKSEILEGGWGGRETLFMCLQKTICLPNSLLSKENFLPIPSICKADDELGNGDSANSATVVPK